MVRKCKDGSSFGVRLQVVTIRLEGFYKLELRPIASVAVWSAPSAWWGVEAGDTSAAVSVVRPVTCRVER